MMTEDKMYVVGRPITLPDNMQISDCMFGMKNHFNLPVNMKETYYLNEVPLLKCNESTGSVSKNITISKLQGGELSMEGLICRQEKILAKLKKITEKLNNLKGTKRFFLEENVEVSSKIDSLMESQGGEMSVEGLKQRQETIVEKLKKIKEKLNNLKGSQMVFLDGKVQVSSNSDSLKSGVIHDIVVSANPSTPPYFLLPLKKALSSNFRILSSSSIHSSVNSVDPSVLRLFNDESPKERSSYDLAFTVLWKDQPTKSMMVNPLSQSLVVGEANILRYISRLFPAVSSFSYESQGSLDKVSETDYWLDMIQNKVLHGNNKERQAVLKQVNSKLGTSEWLVDSSLSLCDVFCWSAIHQLGLHEGLANNVATWFKRMDAAFPIGGLSQVGTGGSETSEKRSLVDRAFLEDFLKRNGIHYQIRNHEEVFTVDALMACVKDMPGLHMKNLFLKDNKKNLYLLSARHDAQIKLSEVGSQVGAKELRFAPEETLFDTLGVKQGCVTLYALLNDSEHKVSLILDSEAFNADHSYVNFHPMSNAATLGVSTQGLQKFLTIIGHKVQLMEF